MLPIAAVLHLVSPFFAGNRLVAAIRLQAKTALHLLLAFFVAGAAYTGTLLAMITAYGPHQVAANLVYGVGFACASLLGIRAVTFVAPVGLGRVIVSTAATLAAVLPLVLLMSHAIASDPRAAGYVWYLIGSLAGGSAGIMLWAPSGAPAPATPRRRGMSSPRPAM